MNAQLSSASLPPGETPEERRKESICWPCILASIPPLLITLAVGWFVASALERGREASAPPPPASSAAAVNLEDDEDGQFAMLRLKEDLDAANKALASAEAKLAAGGGVSSGEGQEALAALESELSQTRAMLRERVAEGAQLKADLAKARTALTGSDQSAAEAGRGLAEAEDKIADLQKRFADESGKRSAIAAELSQLKAQMTIDANAATERETALRGERDAALQAVEAATATLKKSQERETRLKASLERARTGLSRELDQRRGGGLSDLEPSKLLDALAAKPSDDRSAAYADLSAALFAAPEFETWLSSEAAASERDALAALLGSASSDARDDVEKEAMRLKARLASRDARIAQLEASEKQAAESAKAAAKAHQDEIKELSDQLASAQAAATASLTRDPSAAAADAEKSARILELERALDAAPAPDELRALQDKVAILEREAEDAANALNDASAARDVATAALARLSAETQKQPNASGEAQPSDRQSESGTTLVLPSVGAVSADGAQEAVDTLLAERDASIRRLTAALSASLAKNALSQADATPTLEPDPGAARSGSVDLPEIGETTLTEIPNAVAALLARKEQEARRLRASNAALQARLASSGAPADGENGQASARIDLPEIGPVEPSKAPEEVVKLLAVRDRALKAALTENVALKAKLASAEAPRASPKTPSTKPATDGGGAAAVYPKWREAPLQKVGGVELDILSEPIAFGSASAELTKEGRKAVRKLARQLLQSLKKAPRQQWRLVIEGHTDQRPIRTNEFASNWDLSSARAAAVAWELQKQGVPSARLLAVGRAASDPIDARWTRSAFAMNRRIELSLLRLGGASRADEK